MKLNGQASTRSENLFLQVSAYLDLLLRWNARTNLTAIRAPEEITTRHFGESLFAAQQISPAGNSPESNAPTTLADVGSGAGFPGLPIKLWAPQLHVTLIESHQKKATFLREVIRTLNLSGVEVLATRAEQITQTFDTVTLRAVERFDQILPTAARLVRPGGRLSLLIGEDQIPTAQTLLPTFLWEEAHPIPNSQRRVVLLGAAPEEPTG
jgi:16S rRNA (guanine527-N7)-methyltransferase